MERTRVLSVIANLYIGGDEHRLLNLAKYIDRTRFDHRIVCLKRETPESAQQWGTLRPLFVKSGAAIIDLDLEPATRPRARNRAAWIARGAGSMRAAVAQVARLAHTLKADVIDAHIGTGNRVGVMAGLLSRTPTLVTTYHAETFIPYAVWYATQQLTLHCATAIMTDAEETREEIKRWMWRHSAKFFVVPNGTLPPRPIRPRAEMLRAFDIPAGARVVGTIAAFEIFKGHRVLIDAARDVLRTHPDTLFLVVGFSRRPESQRYRAELEAVTAELGIADRFRFGSYEGAIGDVWQVIDVHVHPSLKDSLPNAIIEGMSQRKPQAVTDVGGVAKLVTNGETGLVVPPGDAQALAAATSRLLSEPEFARRLTDASHARYEQSFRPETMARSIENAFTELAR